MEKYLKIDCFASESTNLDMFNNEMNKYVEKYENFIFLTEKKNLNIKYTTPIASLKKMVLEVYSLDFQESQSVIIELPGNVLKELFEKEGNVDKDVFILFKNEGKVIDFNN